MAQFKEKEFSFSEINNGERYQNGDIPDAEAINKPIEASAYAVEMARSALAHTGGSEENLKYVASPNGSYPNMTAGKLGGKWTAEGIVNGVIENANKGGLGTSVWVCAISTQARVVTSTIVITRYHGVSYGSASLVDGAITYVRFENEYDNVAAISKSLDGTTTYEANIIAYYKMIEN